MSRQLNLPVSDQFAEQLESVWDEAEDSGD